MRFKWKKNIVQNGKITKKKEKKANKIENKVEYFYFPSDVVRVFTDIDKLNVVTFVYTYYRISFEQVEVGPPFLIVIFSFIYIF